MSARIPVLRDVLFDLDGTLTDSFEGIARSFEHALRALGRTPPAEAELRRLVGPPLRANFIELLGKDGPIEDAIRIFRERYGTVGMFESSVYAGIAEMLSALKNAGVRCWLCTSKRRDFAERILEHFELRSFFSSVYGTEPDGRFESKVDLARHILESNGIDPRHAALVGDREHDMIAARKSSIVAIGVTYGYGSQEELASSGAHVMCATPKELENLITKK